MSVSRSSSKTARPARSRTDVAIILLAAIAVSVSAYLAWHAFAQGKLIGCADAEVFSCDKVLGSHWSKVLGIPVALAGGATYLVMLLIALARWLVPALRSNRYITSVLVMAAFAAAASGIWFTALQFFVVEKLCWYCLTIHSCGVAIACALTLAARKEAQSTAPVAIGLGLATDASGAAPPGQPAANKFPGFVGQAAVGIVACLALVLTQFFFPTSGHEVTQLNSEALAGVAGFSEETAAESVRTTEVAADSSLKTTSPNSTTTTNADATAPVATEPPPEAEPAKPYRFANAMVVGNPAAEHAIVEVVDYTCVNCRKIYPTLERMIAKYPDQLAIVVVPIATDKSCNQYVAHLGHRNQRSCKFTRLALAVWQLDREAFVEFHRWLLEDESHERVAEAWAYAGKLVGTQELLKAIDSPELAQRLEVNNRVWNKFGKQLPILVVGGKVIRGMVGNEAKLAALIESYLPFNQPETTAVAN